MRVTESLIRKNNMKRKKKNNEDDEPTQTYKDREYRYWSMNKSKSVFGSPFDNGINNSESVFDKKAVFRTGGGKFE